MSHSILTKDEITDLNISFDELKDITINAFAKENVIVFVINILILTKPTLSYYIRKIPNRNN